MQITSTNNYSMPDNSVRVPKKQLDQNDFLQLMMVQLQNQDPLEPQSNDQFIAQMAQFSSLETLAELNKNTQFSEAASFIGKKVTVNDNNSVISGVVDKVAYLDSALKIYIDGNPYDFSQVTEVDNN